MRSALVSERMPYSYNIIIIHNYYVMFQLHLPHARCVAIMSCIIWEFGGLGGI